MSLRQINPAANSPQTVLVTANYVCQASDTNIDVQAPGVTVTLPPNPTVGSTLIELLAEASFNLSGGANPLTSDPQLVPAGETVLAAFTAIGWLISNTSAQLPNTFKLVNAATGPYVARATDVLIEADLSGGALTGSINLGQNAVALRKVTVVDLKWLVNGANLLIPVTGGSVPIQDPNTGAIATGTVQIKSQGAQVTWTFDGTSLVLA